MDLNQRALAARQYLKRAFSPSPERKEANKFIAEETKKIDFMKFMPAARVANTAKYLAPKLIQQGTRAFENDAAQLRAVRHADQAQLTANRIKQAFAQKQRQDMLRAWAGFLTRKF